MSDQPEATPSAFSELLQTRFDQAVRALALNACATRMLHAFVVQDVDQDAADLRDAYGRQGVQAWDALVDRLAAAGHTLAEVEVAMARLTGWGMLQVVGQSPTDPIVSGPAAVRLTAHGRTSVGLSPAVHPGERVEAGKPGWIVLHGLSREGLLREAAQLTNELAWRPIQLHQRDQVRWAAGQVAASICTRGGAVVDGFATQESDRGVLAELMARTSPSHAVQVLILPDPTPVRIAGMVSDLRMRWVEPNTERSDTSQDDRLTDALISRHGKNHSHADVAGVPGTTVALPRRTDTRWEDLIVPERVQSQLRQIMMHARFRLEVLPHRTKFRGRGRGYRLLMSGLPGTGKSMAAEALSSSLGRPIVKLDLSAVLSKWLGETEQLIGRIFDMSEASGSVLVLDEAEALFRQRNSGPGGSNALSTAVAFLLTRLERYSGVLVATTNRTQDLDDAFFRRFDDYLVLPMPDAATRRLIWEWMLAAGRENPDMDIDLDIIAANFPLSGGMIRGSAIRANAWAEGLQRKLDMPVLLAALAREYEKNDQSNRKVFIEPWSADVARLLMDDEVLRRTGQTQ